MTGHIVPFHHRGQASRRSLAAAPATEAAEACPGDDLPDADEERADYRHRMKTNAAVLVVVALLIWGGFWLAETLAQMRKAQDCVLSGRRNCMPIALPDHLR